LAILFAEAHHVFDLITAFYHSYLFFMLAISLLLLTFGDLCQHLGILFLLVQFQLLLSFLLLFLEALDEVVAHILLVCYNCRMKRSLGLLRSGHG